MLHCLPDRYCNSVIVPICGEVITRVAHDNEIAKSNQAIARVDDSTRGRCTDGRPALATQLQRPTKPCLC